MGWSAFRPHSCGRWVGVVLAAVWLSVVALASAADGPAWASVRLGARGAITPGQTLRVTWDPLPPETEELELLLVCESPVPFTMRLTESRDPGLASLPWRVPALSTERARIVVRRGREGRESLWARSAAFRIALPHRVPATRIALRQGEYWLTEDPSPQMGARRPGLGAGGPCDRDDVAEGSGTSPDHSPGPSEALFGSPPPSPKAGPKRAWVTLKGETRPLLLRI